jgi:hypothetical protein
MQPLDTTSPAVPSPTAPPPSTHRTHHALPHRNIKLPKHVFVCSSEKDAKLLRSLGLVTYYHDGASSFHTLPRPHLSLIHPLSHLSLSLPRTTKPLGRASQVRVVLWIHMHEGSTVDTHGVRVVLWIHMHEGSTVDTHAAHTLMTVT